MNGLAVYCLVTSYVGVLIRCLRLAEPIWPILFQTTTVGFAHSHILALLVFVQYFCVCVALFHFPHHRPLTFVTFKYYFDGTISDDKDSMFNFKISSD